MFTCLTYGVTCWQCSHSAGCLLNHRHDIGYYLSASSICNYVQLPGGRTHSVPLYIVRTSEHAGAHIHEIVIYTYKQLINYTIINNDQWLCAVSLRVHQFYAVAVCVTLAACWSFDFLPNNKRSIHNSIIIFLQNPFVKKLSTVLLIFNRR